jgi:hypothetical protein
MDGIPRVPATDRGASVLQWPDKRSAPTCQSSQQGLTTPCLHAFERVHERARLRDQEQVGIALLPLLEEPFEQIRIA